jgi:hypothetical protein
VTDIGVPVMYLLATYHLPRRTGDAVRREARPDLPLLDTALMARTAKLHVRLSERWAGACYRWPVPPRRDSGDYPVLSDL